MVWIWIRCQLQFHTRLLLDWQAGVNFKPRCMLQLQRFADSPFEYWLVTHILNIFQIGDAGFLWWSEKVCGIWCKSNTGENLKFLNLKLKSQCIMQLQRGHSYCMSWLWHRCVKCVKVPEVETWERLPQTRKLYKNRRKCQPAGKSKGRVLTM